MRNILLVKNFIFILIFNFIFLLNACVRNNVFEKNNPIPYHRWDYNHSPKFSFSIIDTISRYNMYLTLRHTDAYPFSNLWVRISSKSPNVEKSTTSRLEVILAQPNGKWLGKGMNEIWEHRILISPNVKFSQKGNYEISLAQDMRINPLPEILSVGIRIEKIIAP